MKITSFGEFKELAQRGTFVPVCKEIVADLLTPVSAFLKLKPFKPRFLLESVEGGERFARYSFIGFGDCLEVRLDHTGLKVDGRSLPVPNTQVELLAALRDALALAPLPQPAIPGLPLLGGLVGVAGYDLVRLGIAMYAVMPSRNPSPTVKSPSLPASRSARTSAR